MKDDKIRSIVGGTVIDHIPSGNGVLIVKLLKLNNGCGDAYLLGHNLKSSKINKKDMLKIENRELSQDEINILAIIAPQATISIIRGSVVTNKIYPELPKEVVGVVTCPNEKCITNNEEMNSVFIPYLKDGTVFLKCRYCEKIYELKDVRIKT